MVVAITRRAAEGRSENYSLTRDALTHGNTASAAWMVTRNTDIAVVDW